MEENSSHPIVHRRRAWRPEGRQVLGVRADKKAAEPTAPTLRSGGSVDFGKGLGEGTKPRRKRHWLFAGLVLAGLLYVVLKML